ncbi:DUF2953 domain-containing protein [Virgibacillus sp. MSP4-1]|uniref:DUF2953 domain-containing protein n=1 Tax=Virgibacillus sp. MSP4-1 TaxID=2700081 RepID=UPI0003A3953C|nr:DUF2953 domain-containing protein [Virgibacillus sp. MSP4-1]QHS23023.1 DUF2953 domain-containing protein [Virgibacillus sp. MSP4-1]
MNWWILILIILAVLALFMILLLCTRLYISISYIHEKDKDLLTIQLQFWRFIRIHRQMSIDDVKEQPASFQKWNQDEKGNGEQSNVFHRFQKLKNQLEFIRQAFPIAKEFIQKIRITEFYWSTHIGIEKDAAITGVISGLLWSIKGSLTGLMYQNMNVLTQPQINIQPNFQRDLINTHLQCMLSFRIGQAMYAILQIARYQNQSEQTKE